MTDRISLAVRRPARRVNWTIARTEYVVGTESFAQLGRRYDVTLKAVEKHALGRRVNGGRTWGEMRREHRAKIAAEAIERIGNDQMAVLRESSIRRLQISVLALQQIVVRLQGRCTIKELVAIANLGIDPHFRVSGSSSEDATSVQLEPLDPATAVLVDRALEAILCAKSEPNAEVAFGAGLVADAA
jgi:hypothetical protein